MIQALSVVFFLYLVSLHSSIAGMEIFGWLTAALGVVVMGQRGGLKNFYKKYRWLLITLALIPIWVAISLLMTPLEKPFLFQFGFMRWTLLLIGLTLAVQALWSSEFEKKLVVVWSVCLGLTGLYATLQFFTGIDLVRPGSGVVNPQAHGLYKAVGFFSMSLSFAYVFGQSVFAAFRPIKARWGQPIALGLLVLSILALAGSMARGAWIGAVVALSIFIFFKARRWIIPYLIVCLAAVAAAKFLRPMPEGGQLDRSSSMRVDLWQAYGQMFIEHPVFGVGIFEGDKLLPQYYTKLGIDQEFTSHAHNNFLQWLAGTGVPGLLLYLFLIFSFLKMAWQIRDKTIWGWGLFLSQVFLHVGGLTECNFFDGEVNHVLMLTWALTWAFHERECSTQ